jgi:hypothetical protein
LAWWLAASVSTLIVGALLVWLAPGALYAAERAVRERLGASVAWGVAIAIGVLARLEHVARSSGSYRGHRATAPGRNAVAGS